MTKPLRLVFNDYSCPAVVLLLAAVLSVAMPLAAQDRPSRGKTVVGIRGSMFTINGELTYTPAAGFPNADTNLIGTLLNVRAVQAVFDDANYPQQGSREHPYPTQVMGPVLWDYPDGKWDPERNTREFIEALPEWRRAGVLAFTVNFQGGGPTDANFGVGTRRETTQPHDNTGFDAEGNLKPAYAGRMERIIAAADRLGMVTVVGFFYFGQNERIKVSPDGKYIRQAVVNGMKFLKALPYRNVLVELNNEISPGYRHPQLQPDGIYELVALAHETGGKEIPVSMSYVAGNIPAPGSKAFQGMRAADYILIHTNSRLPEEVHTAIHAWRGIGGYDRPLMINEDGFSTFNLQSAVQERAGWGYYDQGWSNYRDGFQSPPTNWRISTPLKWLFFEQVARLTGSPIPPRPQYESDDTPRIQMIGLAPNQVVKDPLWVEAIVEDRHPRWPIQRVEFYIDGKPASYCEKAPYFLGSRELWNPSSLSPGKHVIRVVAIDRRGPRFTQTASILEIPIVVEK